MEEASINMDELDRSNWKTIVKIRVTSLLRIKNRCNLVNFVDFNVLFSDSPWIQASKCRSLRTLLLSFSSSMRLGFSGRDFDVISVNLSELEDFLQEKLRFFVFSEGEEQRLRVKTLRQKTRSQGSKVEVFRKLKKSPETRNYHRFKLLKVVTMVKPASTLYFTIHRKRSFSKISFLIEGMQRKRQNYYKLKFPVTRTNQFIVYQLTYRTRNY